MVRRITALALRVIVIVCARKCWRVSDGDCTGYGALTGSEIRNASPINFSRRSRLLRLQRSTRRSKSWSIAIWRNRNSETILSVLQLRGRMVIWMPQTHHQLHSIQRVFVDSPAPP